VLESRPVAQAAQVYVSGSSFGLFTVVERGDGRLNHVPHHAPDQATKHRALYLVEQLRGASSSMSSSSSVSMSVRGMFNAPCAVQAKRKRAAGASRRQSNQVRIE
jgi:hypothetical protein